MFYHLLVRLDSIFLPQVKELERIVQEEGYDYRTYSSDAKKIVVLAAATVKTIKTVLDTPILTEDGALTDESEKVAKEVSHIILYNSL